MHVYCEYMQFDKDRRSSIFLILKVINTPLFHQTFAPLIFRSKKKNAHEIFEGHTQYKVYFPNCEK